MWEDDGAVQQPWHTFNYIQEIFMLFMIFLRPHILDLLTGRKLNVQ